ncbi:MAG: hypothetical protein HZC45_08375 [Deltaproteobacteria bacterium]|nr:hypothetical protein [Deltaproteobacteria bacterium]
MTPFPEITDLKIWDLTLLKRYKPVFKKPIKNCSLCGLGPCKPSEKNVGICGITEDGFRARYALLDCIIGASGHTSNARRLLNDLIERLGRDTKIDIGKEVIIKMPITTLITGNVPDTFADMDCIITYIERQLVHLLSSVSFGSESDETDFASKTMHAGMLDNIAMEVADIVQISAFNMPKGRSTGLINFGMETIDINKFVVLIIGHNSVISHDIAHLLKDKRMEDRFEICGLCCSAIDSSRHGHSHDFKIIGNQSMQAEVVRTGIADVVILDTQCIKADIVNEALSAGSVVITTADETVMGTPNISSLDIDGMVNILLKDRCGFIRDKKRAAETTLGLGVRSQESGVRKKTTYYFTVPTHGLLRIGRGPVRDSEIRTIAPSIIMGEIPGIIGIFGCPEEETKGQGAKSMLFAVKGQEMNMLHSMAEEFLKRGYIVSTGGCSSIDIAKGDTFKETSDVFDSGNIINLGSCVSASHLIGACIKIASIMSHRGISGNYEEIADYIINRVGAVIILWGAFTQKAFATAVGAARLGIPVIFGYSGNKYGLHLLCNGNLQVVMDARVGDEVNVSPSPEHLLCAVKTFEEAMYTAAKFTIRANDTAAGRRIKLKNYIEFYKKTKGSLPSDVYLYIRTSYDIPHEFKQEIDVYLEQTNWKKSCIPDPTLLKRMVRGGNV